MISPPVCSGAACGTAIGIAVILLGFCNRGSCAGEIAQVQLAANAQFFCMLFGMDLVMEARVMGLVAINVIMLKHNRILSA